MDHLTSLENQQEEYGRISQKDLSVMKSHSKVLSKKLNIKGSDVQKSKILYQGNTAAEKLEELQNTMIELMLTERNLNTDIEKQRKVVDKRKKELANLSKDKYKRQQSRKERTSDFNSILINYKKYLQISIILKEALNNEHTFAVCFKNHEKTPVKITINTTDNAIISVDLSHLKKSEAREELENWLNVNKQIVPFLIKLRKCIVKDCIK